LANNLTLTLIRFGARADRQNEGQSQINELDL